MSQEPGKPSAVEAVARCQSIMAHAWMVRTFVKHSEEVADFPELMHVVRAVFDTCRALEPKVGEPQEYLNTLRKKLSKLRTAAVQFADDAPVASDHTNFRQAVISLNACLVELEGVLQMFPQAVPAAMPANFRALSPSANLGAQTKPTSSNERNDDVQ